MNSLGQIIVILSILHITVSFTPSSILIETSGDEAIYNRHARPFLATWRQNTKRVTIGKAMKILDWAFGDRVSTIFINEQKFLAVYLYIPPLQFIYFSKSLLRFSDLRKMERSSS